MATTTATTPWRSAGQPDDSVGSVNDICFDSTNRIIWVKQSGNTWVGGGYSNIGPVGPAQLSYNGVPPSTFGQNGNGATDQSTGLTYIKANGAWTQVGNNLGPAGPAGFTALTTQAMTVGNQLIANGTTASSTAQYLPIVGGTTQPQYFVPQQGSAFLGFNAANTGVALTLTLMDVTAGSTVYSASAASNSQVNVGPFTSTQYPLVAGRLYAWTYTGSGTANLVLNPYYLTQAAATAGCVGTFSNFCSPINTAFTSTAFNAVIPGASSTANVNTRTFQLLRAGAAVSIVPTYYPSVAGAATASVSWGLYNYTSGATLATGTTTNTGLPQPVTFTSPIAMPASNTIFMKISGSGTGTWVADLNAVI